MTKAQHISEQILYLNQNVGLPLKEAFDLVLGKGRYDTLVDELYHGLRGQK